VCNPVDQLARALKLTATPLPSVWARARLKRGCWTPCTRGSTRTTSNAESAATAPPSAHTTRHYCNIIGARWRVNGGHGASLKLQVRLLLRQAQPVLCGGLLAGHQERVRAGGDRAYPHGGGRHAALLQVRDAGRGQPVQVSRPFPSWNRSILTEIYLSHAGSCQEILRTETAGQVPEVQGAPGRQQGPAADQGAVRALAAPQALRDGLGARPPHQGRRPRRVPPGAAPRHITPRSTDIHKTPRSTAP
jgi:hypothetical protein